jgi:hypothetical protein
MKVLLDECVTHDLRPLVAGHDVYTVAYLGWSGTTNGRLIARAAADGFDVLVTTDKNIRHQVHEATLPIPVVILDVATNDVDDVRPLVPGLLALLAAGMATYPAALRRRRPQRSPAPPHPG